MDNKCPLSEQDCQTLNALLQSCADTECLLAKLEAIGLDVSSLRADNTHQQVFFDRTKRTFFPDHP